MNIFYVLNSRFPTIKAYGLQVAKTCQGFVRAGANVNLIVPIRKRHREIYGITWTRLYGITNSFRQVRLLSLDFAWLHLNISFLFTIQQLFFALLASAYLIGKQGIIYSRDQFVLYVLSFWKKNLFWEIHRLPASLSGKMYRRLLSRLAGIVVISNGLKNKLIEVGVDPARILVAHDGIDLEEFKNLPNQDTARNQLDLPHDKKLIIYTGHLFEWKGVDTFISAAQNFSDDTQAIIVGGTDEDVGRAKKIDVKNKIIFIEFKPHGDVLKYLTAADILILPNKKDGGISEFYTSPLKLFEYMASGKPIIASNLSSLREVLNESNSVLIEPDSSEALAQAIIITLQNKEKMAQLGSQAQRDVGIYDWTVRAKHIIDFINAHEISG